MKLVYTFAQSYERILAQVNVTLILGILIGCVVILNQSERSKSVQQRIGSRLTLLLKEQQFVKENIIWARSYKVIYGMLVLSALIVEKIFVQPIRVFKK